MTPDTQQKRQPRSNGSLWADNRFWNILISVAVVLGGIWILSSRVPDAQTGVASGGKMAAPQKGFQAPDFSLNTLDGATVRLSDLRGRPVLINFWASWCAPCRVEMPHIQSAFEAHTDDGLIVLGVNQSESPPTVARFAEGFDLTFPIPLDGSGEVSSAYRARSLPTSFFVDPNGVIRDVFIGPMTTGLIESKLELILSNKTTGDGG